MIDECFDLHGRGTTAGREVRGGITTFLAMAYILFANPSILAAAGVPFEPAVAATAAAAAICTLLMGLGANFPIALAACTTWSSPPSSRVACSLRPCSPSCRRRPPRRR